VSSADGPALLSALQADGRGLPAAVSTAPVEDGPDKIHFGLGEGRPFNAVLLPVAADDLAGAVARAAALWAADPRLEIVLACPDDAAIGALAARIPEEHADRAAYVAGPPAGHAAARLLRTLSRKWDLERLAAESFDQVFNASPLPQSIIALDTFEVITVNRAYERMIGFTAAQLRGTTPESFGRGLNAQRWRALLERLARDEPVDEYTFVYSPAPGKRVDMRCSARKLTVRGRPCSIWVIRDVTQQLRLEEQARQSQKMDAIGQLASGVAHDFNNLLTAIHGFTSQAMMDTADEKIRSLLEPVLATAKRAAALTRQLLIFGRQQPVEIRPLDIAQVARDLKTVLRRLMSEHIELVWDLPDSLPPVMADVTNIEQIIVNLAINSRDALPPRGGTIRISAGVREFATAEETGHADGRAGRFVTLQVGDTGGGIPPDVLSRIFEPFFTTKAAGKGTGLGLSTVYSAVRQHGGWIDVQSAVGQGTIFTIFQPVMSDAAAAAAGEAASARRAVPGSFDAAPSVGRVLAVDDDPSVQSVLRLLFDRYNIDSRIAADAPSALQIWQESSQPFDILVTDMVMPNGCNGAELATELRARHPKLKVVLMTGYSSDIPGANGARIPGEPPQILVKPFELADVLAALHHA
jgi:PAS domain S-box-containing protein